MPEKTKSVSSVSTLMPRMGLTGRPARTAALHAGHFFFESAFVLVVHNQAARRAESSTGRLKGFFRRPYGFVGSGPNLYLPTLAKIVSDGLFEFLLVKVTI